MQYSPEAARAGRHHLFVILGEDAAWFVTLVVYCVILRFLGTFLKGKDKTSDATVVCFTQDIIPTQLILKAATTFAHQDFETRLCARLSILRA